VHINVNEWMGSAAEHPFSVMWWMPFSECDHPMSAHDCHWVIIECDSPWCDHENDCICVRIEQPLNTIECIWMPVSEYWITPEQPLSGHECLWESAELPLNANKCVWMWLSVYWTPPEHPLSTHECIWVSISKVWICTSRVVNSTNL
jgi:hypothetical protein